MTARPRAQTTPPGAPAPFRGPTNRRAGEAGPSAGSPPMAAAGFRAGKAALRRPASPPPPAPRLGAPSVPRQNGAVLRSRRRGGAPPAENRRLTASGGTPGVRERLLAEPGSPEREGPTPPIETRSSPAESGGRLRFRLGSARTVSSAVLSRCPAGGGLDCRFLYSRLSEKKAGGAGADQGEGGRGPESSRAAAPGQAEEVTAPVTSAGLLGPACCHAAFP